MYLFRIFVTFSSAHAQVGRKWPNSGTLISSGVCCVLMAPFIVNAGQCACVQCFVSACACVCVRVCACVCARVIEHLSVTLT